jgi:Fe-S cluster assembly scaffold protein SufB
MQDYELILNAYTKAGGTPEVFKNSNIAHLVVHKNKVIGKHLIKGLILEPRETPAGVNIKLNVEKGIKIENPVHLCFGVLPKEGIQEIYIEARIEDDSKIIILAHCVFPNAVKVTHKMNADIYVGNNAFYEYNEVHFHGETGGIEVIPEAKIRVGNNSHLITNFSLLKGRVGLFDLDYDSEIGDNSVVEMTTKIYGYGDDVIKIKEGTKLLGSSSRGLLKSRIAVKENAQTEVINEIIASGFDARGHVDCIEIVQGNARARAVPIVNVTNEFASVTHEAAIGRIDKKQIETLMARGLEEEKAIDLVVSGMLK